METKKLIINTLLLILFVTVFPVSAELMGSDTYGYSLDLPEGFVLTDSTGDGKGYQFQNIYYPVELLVRIYSTSEYESVEKALSGTLVRLSAKAENATISWRNTDCSLSQFQMQLNGTSYGGWGVCAKLPEEKGYLLMLAYSTTSDNADQIYQSIILSAVDSIYIDRGSFYCAGPITTFAYPETAEKQVTLNIAGKEIETIIKECDVIANEFVVEREFNVLKLFADTDLWLEAWLRYYRQIYRDAYNRMARPAFDIYAALYQEARTVNAESPQLAMAQFLLSWVQEFGYDREYENSDFTPIPALITGEKGSDCDSRSMLLAILLRHMNMNTTMFVSTVYSHAMLGVALNKDGAKIQVDEIWYLLGETTDQVKLGLVAQEMSVTENWIPVIFP
ncbi:MAG: hypothetical protein J6B81_03975 [Spirochaetaceae bacterium]|nr:hypothetical protein [Spirochaetaceae bacterium]